MFRSSRTLVAVVSVAALSACNDNTTNVVHTTNFAIVRLANATDVPITIAGNGVVDTINTNIPFGSQSACLIVDLTNTTPLLFTNSATGATISFTSTLFFGGNFTIVAFANANGVIQFATLTNRFTPIAGDAALRIFNGAFGSSPLFVTGDGATLTAPAGFSTASPFANVSAAPQAVTVSNGISTVINAGTLTFPAGQNTTLVVGPAATGTIPLRFFTTLGC